MLRRWTTGILCIVLAHVGQLNAAEISVANVDMLPGTTANVIVSATISGESTYGVNVLLELIPQAGATGTVTFTPSPPMDVYQAGDPWPGDGTFTAYDTDTTLSSTLNGSVDDDGSFVAAPVTYSGPLTGFPVIANAAAAGVWDVVLSTSVGDSSWQDLSTTLVAGTVTVIVGECINDPDCDDGVGCTDDTCVSANCVYTVNDANCSGEGAFCNGVEFCDDVLDCVSPGDPCAPAEFCNESTDTCDECQVAGDCDDLIACTDNACVGGSCVFTENDANCAPDGAFCNGQEVCDDVAGCVSPGDPCGPTEFCNESTDTCDECLVSGDCSDGIGCTDDACVGGLCVFTANDANCPDDLAFCNGVESCNPSLDCVSSGDPCAPQVCDEIADACGSCTLDPECDDGNVCTDDACNAGLCDHTNNTASCDDGLFCTGNDSCVGGSCVSSGDPCTLPLLCREVDDTCGECVSNADCNDGDVCTDDVCNAGTCESNNNTAPCNDGLFCTATDVCSGGVCVGGGDPCAGQVCDEASNACLAPAASLTVANLDMEHGTVAAVQVLGDIAGLDTYGVNILAEIIPRAGNVGTVTFTPAPPADIVPILDPWPSLGLFSAYDTDTTGSPTLNGAVTDNGSFVPAPILFSGALASFPVVASSDAGGAWDVVLSTSAGDSSWEGVTTTLVSGTITVEPPVGLVVNSFAMPPGSTVDLVVSGVVENQSFFGVTVMAELVPRGGTTGALVFTPAPPIDIVQLDDAWAGQGAFTPFDTDPSGTGSSTLNGCIDDNGTFVESPLTFSGDLAAFPVIASQDASGVWDVRLSTALGDSRWDDLAGTLTVRVDGTITVSPTACILDLDCDDANTCTADVCNAGVCEYTLVVGACSDGDPCTTGDTCSGPVCIGTAVDCSSLDNTCGIGTCNPTNGICEATPTNEGGACDDSSLCTLNDLCVSGACTGTPVDCASLDDACNIGTCVPADGSCAPAPANEGGACDDGDLCTENDACSGGACAGTDVDCTGMDDQCNVGTCNPASGVCEAIPILDGTMCDDGDLCTETDACLGGVCAGSPIDCASLDDQCNVGQCNATSGLCEAVPTNEGGTCDDGNGCTQTDVCTAGVCGGTDVPGCQQCSVPGECDDSNICTADDCVGGACTYTNLTVFCNDGDSCTVNDVCSGGSCNGAPKDCTSFTNTCNVGTCNATTGACFAQPVNEGGTCNDGLVCTINDTCVGGVCFGTLVVPPTVDLEWVPSSQVVSVGQVVRFDLVASSGTCAVQPVGAVETVLNWNPQYLQLMGRVRPTPLLFTNSTFPNDSGLDGLNAPYTYPPGNDGNALWQGYKNVSAGVAIPTGGIVIVSFDFLAVDGTTGTQITMPATYGSFSRTRVLGAGIFLGVDVTGILDSASVTIIECQNAGDCNDANVCTTDSCISGVCSYAFNTASCSDGLFCTINDTCSGGGCVGGVNPCASPLLCSESLDACVECLSATDCNDGNVCTNDSCSATGFCQHTNNALPCNDGLFCTVTDRCGGGACTGTGARCSAPTPVCDEGNDQCVECLTNGNCTDTNVCTTDTCSLNVCQHSFNTLPCNDGLFCTDNEQCTGGLCIGDRSPCVAPLLCKESSDSCVECLQHSDCDDGNICTTNTCSILGTCSQTNNTLPCPDGVFCNGNDVCTGGTCVSAGDPCGVQLCDEGGDRCVQCFTPGDCADDGLFCTTTACNDGTCVHVPNDAVCNDGTFCNGVEFCHTTLGCRSPGSPCDDPALCDEGNDRCGCQEPIVAAEGSRYIGVTPRAGATPVALLVTGVDAGASCISLYVQADGTLAANPVTRPPSGTGGWGTAHVRGAVILPTTSYIVQSECNTGNGIGLSTPALATTWVWGDTDNSGAPIDVLDITFVTDAFRSLFQFATFYSTDLWGATGDACAPQGEIDVLDLIQVIDAFRGLDPVCPSPCP